MCHASYLSTLAQLLLNSCLSPRERGRHNGAVREKPPADEFLYASLLNIGIRRHQGKTTNSVRFPPILYLFQGIDQPLNIEGYCALKAERLAVHRVPEPQGPGVQRLPAQGF